MYQSGSSAQLPEKQVRQLQSDNDLLKKALAFFAMEMNNDKKSL
jgi:transposase